MFKVFVIFSIKIDIVQISWKSHTNFSYHKNYKMKLKKTYPTNFSTWVFLTSSFTNFKKNFDTKI